ncbi:MAG: hypothetical protein JSV44_08995 [Candidatus Zixiibacteriota bacterium]|nr:MAG: hypothetical protein JSV44_08995 [candidate division Zixibacteria bacterium]
MPYCPRCRETFSGDLSSCPRCDYEFEGSEATPDGSEDGSPWVLIARINDATSANFAKETLQSYDIPAVLFSESGFFGQAGLNLPQAYGKQTGQFQVHVPRTYKEEAEDILTMILGDKWEKPE